MTDITQRRRMTVAELQELLDGARAGARAALSEILAEYCDAHGNPGPLFTPALVRATDYLLDVSHPRETAALRAMAQAERDVKPKLWRATPPAP